MPCNLFGPNDNYDLKTSHFLPALIKKIYLASKKKNKIVKVWIQVCRGTVYQIKWSEVLVKGVFISPNYK